MRIWLAAECQEHKWTTLTDLADKHLPDHWRQVPEAAQKAGHGCSDYFVLKDFVDVITANLPNPIDVHAAMDMTLPCLVSQQSIQEGGRWMQVPDSREW